MLLIATGLVFSMDKPAKVIRQEASQRNSSSNYPQLELKGRVAEIFTFSDLEWISGLSCRITYNGKKPLPSRVFFFAYDEKGKLLSKRIRLIYPRLNSGESGIATFRIKGHPSKIVIWSEGAGPWEDPY